MVVVITSLELKDLWKFFGFANAARKIVRQLKKTNHQGYKSKGLGKTHFTMSLWPDEQSKNDFYRSGAHAKAMEKTAKYAKSVRFYVYEGDQLPNWDEAKRLLAENGRVVRY